MKHIKERKQFLATEGIKKSDKGFEFDWLNDNPDDVMPLKYKKYRGRVMDLILTLILQKYHGKF